MKWKIMTVLLIFSLAANAAALVEVLRDRPSPGCPGLAPALADPTALGLTPDQIERFERLDGDFRDLRKEVQQRLRVLRSDLLECIVASHTSLAACEEILSAMSAEQLSLQRRLVENMRQKLDLLSPEQREPYQKMLRQLTGVGGCGCIGCTGSCH